MKTKILLLQVLCLGSLVLTAQTNFYNNGILKLNAASDTVYVTGNFTNTASAALTNNGQFYVLKDLDNAEASMTAGTGKLYLSGSSAQTLSGTQPFKTYDLVSNNSSGITLNNNLHISGAHTFTNGVITTSGTPDYLIYEAGSTYSGSGDTKHVNGWVKKIGNTDFTFPVGNGTYLRHVAIEALSSSSEFNARYDAPTPNQFQLQFPLLSLDPYEYWEVNKVSGGTAAVHLNWDNNKVTFPGYIMGDMAVAYYDGASWTDQGGSASGDVSTTGDITSNSVSSFGNFAIASRSFPLPLKFLSFTAQRKEEYVELKWVTAEEINTDHFEIERSHDGVQFSSLFKMPTVNRFTTQEYSYKDFSDVDRVAFYRIRCVDKDGRSKFSKVVAVFESSYLQKNIQVLNPATDEIIIRSQVDDKESTAYVLYNQAGSAILKGNLKLKGGMDNTIRLSFKPAKGVYYLMLIRANKEFVQKLVIN
jgi:hypothetical protein